MEKFLPLGIQNFDQMIKGNFVYIDKTRYIYNMVRAPQGFYFLSRPRRFGKSLLVSTLRSLFEAKRELFQKLWIEQTDWDWQRYSIVLFDFSGISSESPIALRKGILNRLQQISLEHDLDFKQDMIPEGFRDVVINLNRKYQRSVVILVDEYDRPIIEHLGRGSEHLEVAKENRYILKSFYSILKDADVSAVVRFVLLTGISKFSKVSIFSELNNLDDLTLQKDYSGLLGYTEDELFKYFSNHVENLSKELGVTETELKHRIQDWYNGYCFADPNIKVYNPFSILSLFKQREFKNFWFETATPNFLLNLIKEKKYSIPSMETLELPEDRFSAYDLDFLRIEPLLIQTGYLSIQSIKGNLYKFGFPNHEVKSSFLDYLYNQIVEIDNISVKEQFRDLHDYLKREAFEGFITTINAILSSIPYQHIYDQDEHYYHTVFYLMLSASGVSVSTEVLTAYGRIDLEVHFQEKIYIIELKCNQTAKQAIQQIKEKKYFEKHLGSQKKIILLGINFGTRQRRILDWKVERL